jgi:hypothetical protein
LSHVAGDIMSSSLVIQTSSIQLFAPRATIY